jgi:arginase family enzyme
MMHKHSIRPFGVALDASDDPWSIELKLASIYAQQQGMIMHMDPYDALIAQLTVGRGFVKPGGKLPLPSWLGPIPDPSDLALVSQEHTKKFLDGDGPFGIAERVKDFVLNQIVPGVPLMLGIDHSATGGVITALSNIYGSDKLTVLVLDRHFDALSLSARMDLFDSMPGRPDTSGSSSPAITDGDRYCCGNFWAYLIANQIVKPEHLLFIGVADYPGSDGSPQYERFRNSYLEFERQGCSFFPLSEFDSGLYGNRLRHFLDEKIKTPYLYVSLDVDVGAYRSVLAARYMDGPGIDKSALLKIGHLIAECCRPSGPYLIGLDVMEFNMHVLGAEIEPGMWDGTAATALDFINILFGSLGIAGEPERI